MEKRNAAGVSAEELALQDAFMEGQRAGARGHSAGLNPFSDPRSSEFQEWERGRNAAEGMRLARTRSA